MSSTQKIVLGAIQLCHRIDYRVWRLFSSYTQPLMASNTSGTQVCVSCNGSTHAACTAGYQSLFTYSVACKGCEQRLQGLAVLAVEAVGVPAAVLRAHACTCVQHHVT